MKREFIDYLNDIFSAIEKVERFTQGMDMEGFVEDEKTRLSGIQLKKTCQS